MSQFARGGLPGHGTIRESIESQVQFIGINGEMNARIVNATIDSASVDSGNTPTTTLRGGLVLGKVTATQEFKPYSATATDGSQVAVGILLESQDMLDPYGTAEDKYTGRVVVGGNIDKDSVFGLTPQAEQQLINQGIYFNETPMPMASKLVAHNGVLYAADDVTLTNADNGKLVVVSEAGAFVATLPAIATAEGIEFMFVQTVDQSMTISSAEGDNVLALDNATADGVAFSTADEQIGAMCIVKCIRTGAGTLKWVAIPLVGTMTIVSA